MRKNSAQMEALFQKAVHQDGGDVVEVLEFEHAYLYDYLLRMTGQVALTTETIEELYRVLAPQAPHYESWSAFRVLIYTTARNFNLDVWNAETPNLVNSGLERVEDADNLYELADHQIRHLPGPIREAFICVLIYGFTIEETARILRRSVNDLRQDIDKVLSEIEKKSRKNINDIKRYFLHFPLHQPQGLHSNNTVALSQVMERMEEVERRHRREVGRRRFLMLIFLASIGGAFYFIFYGGGLTWLQSFPWWPW